MCICRVVGVGRPRWAAVRGQAFAGLPRPHTQLYCSRTQGMLLVHSVCADGCFLVIQTRAAIPRDSFRAFPPLLRKPRARSCPHPHLLPQSLCTALPRRSHAQDSTGCGVLWLARARRVWPVPGAVPVLARSWSLVRLRSILSLCPPVRGPLGSRPLGRCG